MGDTKAGLATPEACAALDRAQEEVERLRGLLGSFAAEVTEVANERLKKSDNLDNAWLMGLAGRMTRAAVL